MTTPSKKRVGFALCGSFCTLRSFVSDIRTLVDAGYEVTPIMSETVYETSTRFGDATEFIREVETVTGKKILHTRTDVEPIGPKQLLDLLLIAPCTGNTLAKIASGISDSSVSLAAKAHLRNERPVLIALSTNDALSGNAKNLGVLLNTKHVYFVPLRQDDPKKKPSSLVAVRSLILPAVEAALEERQIQPLFMQPSE